MAAKAMAQAHSMKKPKKGPIPGPSVSIPSPQPIPQYSPMAPNSEPVTDDDVKVLYRICTYRSVLVGLLEAHIGGNGDAELYERVMGKLQYAMDQMGLTCV